MHSRLLTLVLVPSLCLAVAAPATQAARAGLPTHVNECWPDDNGDPVIDSVTLDPTTVDAGDGPATVDVTVDAHDTGDRARRPGWRR